MSQSHVLRATTRSVDLGESFQTHIYLQTLASIQPRTLCTVDEGLATGRVHPYHRPADRVCNLGYKKGLL